MSRGAAAKLEAARQECLLHAGILAEDLAEHGDGRYDASTVQKLDKATVRLLDQMAYRFTKLQDTLGEKLLPLLLEVSEEPIAPEAPFAEKLQRLERLGFIPSAEQWRALRIARNAIAHEYPDQPDLKAAALNRFVGHTRQLLAFWERVRQAGT